MIPILPLLIIALVQGGTEFLPISSSGHLVLVARLHSGDDPGHLIDAAAHLGTLLAVVIALRHEVFDLATGTRAILAGRPDSPPSRLVISLAVATLPLLLLGAILHWTGLAAMMRNLTVIGATTLIFGLALYLADRLGRANRPLGDFNWRSALVVGIFQAIALVPGTSRSGITITACRMLGFGRQEAIRLSFLLSIPAILFAGLFALSSLTIQLDIPSLAAAGLVAAGSFVVGFAVIHMMLRLHRTMSFTPYVIYRLILGAVLLAIA